MTFSVCLLLAGVIVIVVAIIVAVSSEEYLGSLSFVVLGILAIFLGYVLVAEKYRDSQDQAEAYQTAMKQSIHLADVDGDKVVVVDGKCTIKAVVTNDKIVFEGVSTSNDNMPLTPRAVAKICAVANQ